MEFIGRETEASAFRVKMKANMHFQSRQLFLRMVYIKCGIHTEVKNIELVMQSL